MNKGLPEHLLYKNRLQEYAQRSGWQLPVYETTSEGFPHSPKFKASVRVNETTYTSLHTFPHKKDAEQNVANIALQTIKQSTKAKPTTSSSIYLDPKCCKSVLNEFAFWTNRTSPTYETIQQGRLNSGYVSSLAFDGKTYQGKVVGSKQEAEQLVARIAIESLQETDSGILLQLINSKNKATPATGVNRAKNRSPQCQRPVQVGTSQQPVNVSSSFPNLNSGGPSATPNQKKKRTMGDDSSKQKQKQIRSHWQ